jgi:hypothetical protein
LFNVQDPNIGAFAGYFISDVGLLNPLHTDIGATEVEEHYCSVLGPSDCWDVGVGYNFLSMRFDEYGIYDPFNGIQVLTISQVAGTPEPSACFLLGGALIFLLLFRKRSVPAV